MIELALQAALVPPLMPSLVAPAPQALESHVAVARIPERSLNGGDGRHVGPDPFERIAQAAQGAPHGVEGANVVRSTSQAATACERPSGKRCTSLAGDVPWDGWHAAQCLDGTDEAIARQGAAQPLLGRRPQAPQVPGPLRWRALLQLYVDVADASGLVPEPPKVVVEHVPSAELEPDA